MLAPFKINTVNLDNKGRHLDGLIPADELEVDELLKGDFVTSMSDVRYSIHASMVSGALLISGTLEFSVECVCGRCLEKFEIKFTCMEVCHYYEDRQGADEIDIAADIREDALIGIPTIPLCSEACRGLCRNCGCNLNVKDCGCETESENTESKADEPGPWGALDALKLD